MSFMNEQTLFINPFNLQIVPKEKNKFHSKSDYDTETETDNEFEDNTCIRTQKIVNRKFFTTDCITLSKQLLGKVLVRVLNDKHGTIVSG
eukprot:120337_1